jgi:hypothetical protein
LRGKGTTRHNTVRPALSGRFELLNLDVGCERHDCHAGLVCFGRLDQPGRRIPDRHVHQHRLNRVIGFAIVDPIQPLAKRRHVPGRSAYQAKRLGGRMDLGGEYQVLAAVNNHPCIIAISARPGAAAPRIDHTSFAQITTRKEMSL